MEMSPEIDKLATALAKAQASGCPEIEGRAIADYVSSTQSFLTNASDKRTPFDRFVRRIAFGVSECWYWCGSRDASGYGRTSKKYGSTFAHRVSWQFSNGPIPDGMKVLHKCDVRNCVNPDHLFLGTQADNVADMIAKGRARFPKSRFGEENPMSKLTKQDVLNIKKEYEKCQTPMATIAKKYNVATMTIQRAIKGTSWSN